MRPYCGILVATADKAVFTRKFKEMYGRESVIEDGVLGHCASGMNRKRNEWTCLVYAETAVDLAHELSHAVISLFDRVGIPINQANDEAFCYMLSQLMSDTRSLYETRRNKGVRK